MKLLFKRARAGLGLALAAALGAAGWWAAEPRPAPGPAPEQVRRMPDFPAIVAPPRLRAADPRVVDDDPVVGVEVSGRHRAYALTAFSDIDLHVVNDLVGGHPVTVAYCPRTDCLTTYGGPAGGGPLAVAVGGWAGQPGHESLLLRLGDRYYRQDGGPVGEGEPPFPYRPLDHELTTWGAWRAGHPDTDLYAGPVRVGR